MIIEYLDTSPHFRLKKIIGLLENLHGVTINFDAVKDKNHLEAIYLKYAKIKESILLTDEFNVYHLNETYTRASLIQEAIKIFLSEIAPKRKKHGASRSMKNG